MNIQELLKLSPEDIIKKVDSGDISDAIVYTLPLDTALTNFQVELAGNIIICVAGTATTTAVDLEFNRIGNGKTTFTQGLTLIRPFARFFVTNTAQAGATITFIVSSYAPLFGVQDNRSNQLQLSTLQSILDELRGIATPGTTGADTAVGTTPAVKALDANTSRKSFCITADSANTGKIFVGFDNTVSTSKKIFILSAGMSAVIDDYRGTVYVISDASSQKFTASEW